MSSTNSSSNEAQSKQLTVAASYIELIACNEYFSDEISAAQITTDDDNLSIIGNVDDMEWMDTEEVTSHEGGDGDIDDADREWGNSMDDLFSYIDDDLLIGADINYWSDVDISEEDSDDNGILTPDFSSHSETE